jgi:Spondin_N
MKLRTLWTAAAVAVLWASMVAGPSAADHPRERSYEVTITNLTSGQPLTPPAVATHKGGFHVFEVGQAAFYGVKEIAENGNLEPLLFDLARHKKVSDSLATTTGPLVPDGTPGAAMFEDSVTFTIDGGPGVRYLSFVSMLVCTNDGFTGLDGLRLPSRMGRSLTVSTNGYDAGTEINTEDFADLVPPCQSLIGVSSGEPGTGTSNPSLAEGGVIHHHPGIAGGADLIPQVHGWTDPVAEVTVTRIA